MKKSDFNTMNYSDILYTFFSDKDTICHDRAEVHFIMYVISGKVLVTENGREYAVHRGECVFVRKDHRVMFSKNTHDNEPYNSITLRFNRNYLREFYQN